MAASLFKWLMLYTFLFSYDMPNGVPGKSSPGKHPLYVTVTEITHNAKDKSLELSCKIFTNDFETALEKTIHSKMDLSAPKDKKATDKAVSDYILRHLQLKVDGKNVMLQFVGSEKETDATWTYFQATNISSVKKLTITNTLLYESFSEEINIMHVKVGDDQKSSKLNNPDVSAVFEF